VYRKLYQQVEEQKAKLDQLKEERRKTGGSRSSVKSSVKNKARKQKKKSQHDSFCEDTLEAQSITAPLPVYDEQALYRAQQ